MYQDLLPRGEERSVTTDDLDPLNAQINYGLRQIEKGRAHHLETQILTFVEVVSTLSSEL